MLPLVHVCQPASFQCNGDFVLELKKSIYGLCQSSRNFFHYLSKHLVAQGLTHWHLILASSLGNLWLSWFMLMTCSSMHGLMRRSRPLYPLSKLQAYAFIMKALQKASLVLISSVPLMHPVPKSPFSRLALLNALLKLWDCAAASPHPSASPTEASPLPKDDNGQPASGSFNYAAVVGILLYLSGHSRPDIAFAVHQCARYTFHPTRRHELSLIRFGRYLKGT